MTAPARQTSKPGAAAPGRAEPRRPRRRGRRSGAALARIETRHLARSPLLLAGVALALPLLYLELNSVWPALAGDDLVAYRDLMVVGGGALLAGAWLALRDRVTGAADLLAVTPTAPWRVQRRRLAAVAAVAAGAFALPFAAVLAFSAVRGGRGSPDLRLLADGMLFTVLSGWVGLAVGRLSGSRMVAVLAAPVWVAVCLFGPMVLRESDLPVQRLLPALTFEERSAAFGFLPDALWPHLAYLAGVVLLAGVLLLALAARGSAQRPPLAPMLAAVLAGLLLVGVFGPRLAALPDLELVVGPGAGDRQPVSAPHDPGIHPDPSFVYPADDHARTCAGDPATLTICVYPAYGVELVSFLRAGMDPVARLLAGLPGLPTQARMVPTSHSWQGSCDGTEMRLPEAAGRSASASGVDPSHPSYWASIYLRCALGAGGVDPTDTNPVARPRATQAVELWALLASGVVTRQELDRAMETGEARGALTRVAAPDVGPVALAMTRMRPDQVRAELAPVWARLRAGTLPAAELPGQRP
jgi:hypothetical protein